MADRMTTLTRQPPIEQEERRMKLFVWADPYEVSYGTSGLFVVAETVEKARELAQTGTSWAYVQYRQKDPDWSRIKLGEPTRVVDLPCAEWHRWEE